MGRFAIIYQSLYGREGLTRLYEELDSHGFKAEISSLNDYKQEDSIPIQDSSNGEVGEILQRGERFFPVAHIHCSELVEILDSFNIR